MALSLRNYGWDKVQASDSDGFTPLPAGAYVCKIVNAELKSIKDKGLLLVVSVDICEGAYSLYYSQNKMPSGEWNFNAQFSRYMVKSTDRLVTPAFKGFIKKLEQQNPNFRFNIDDADNMAQFNGLICGFTFAQREYLGKNDEIKLATTLKFPILADDVRKGNFKIPDIDRLPPEKRPSPTKQDEDKFFDGTDVPDSAMPWEV